MSDSEAEVYESDSEKEESDKEEETKKEESEKEESEKEESEKEESDKEESEKEEVEQNGTASESSPPAPVSEPVSAPPEPAESATPTKVSEPDAVSEPVPAAESVHVPETDHDAEAEHVPEPVRATEAEHVPEPTSETAPSHIESSAPEPIAEPAPAEPTISDDVASKEPEVDHIGKEESTIGQLVESGDSDLKIFEKTSHAKSSSSFEEVHTSSSKSSTSFGSISASKFDDFEVDKDFASKLLSSVNEGGYKSTKALDKILNQKTVGSSSSSVTYVSSESRQVMRKGYDLSLQGSSSGLRSLYETRIKELEDELDVEKNARYRSEKQRAELQRDLGQATEKVDEANEAFQQQVELLRRRENEFHNLQRDTEEAQSQNESQITAFRKKHQETLIQLTEQLDAVHKAKQKSEKEKHHYQLEVEELKSQIDHLNTAKIQTEKQIKTLDGYVNELNQRLTAAQRDFSDIQAIKNRLQGENADLVRKIEENTIQMQQMNNTKQLVVKQAEELKATLREEATIRAKLIGDNRNLQTQLDELRDQLNEEREAQSELSKQLAKAVSEGNMWHQKYQSNEGNIKPEELDEVKKKMAYRVQDVEVQLEASLSKIVSLEKARTLAQLNNEALVGEVEKLQIENGLIEKRVKQFEKTTEEWKRKVTEVQMELESSHKSSRSSTAELAKVSAQLDESKELIEGLRRENKNISGEVSDLNDQLAHANQRLLEVEKLAKRFETERQEMQLTLEDAELALAREEGKVQKALMDVAAARAEIEKRISEKEEEFESSRKSHQKAIESMQSQLEIEARNKVDTLKMKKKLEQNINELELALDRMTKTRIEMDKVQKKYQQQILDLQSMVEDEQRQRHKIQEEFAATHSKSGLLGSEVEDLKHQLEAMDKVKKTLDGDLHEATQRINELVTANSNLMAAKKQLETDFHIVQVDNEEQMHSLNKAEDQVRKAVADFNRMAEELQKEQNHSSETEKQKRNLELQVKDLQVRLEATEAMAVQGGKSAMARLEQRIRELEVELEGERLRQAEREKTARKQERRMQEMELQVEDNHRVQERMHDMIDKLTVKIKNYKGQVDEAEEVAGQNLAKYRKIQHDLEESETRADLAEKMVEQLRTKTLSQITVSESAVTQPYSSGFTLTKMTTTTSRSQMISSIAESKYESKYESS